MRKKREQTPTGDLPLHTGPDAHFPSWPLDLECGSAALKGVTPLSVVVGRNGTGKSRFLREIGEYLFNKGINVLYMSPERGGVFEQTPETGHLMQPFALKNERFRNHVPNYRTVSTHFLRTLQQRFSPEMEWEDVREADRLGKLQEGQGPWSYAFANEYLAKINSLLTNVTIEESSDAMKETLAHDLVRTPYIFKDPRGVVIPSDALSSGEMEIITLASEALWFFDYAKRDRDRLHMMLMDEPDLHLHPDLQARFARFMISELEKLRRPPDASKRVRVVMATHSTSLICAVPDSQLASIGTKYYGENTVNQRKIDIGFRRTAHFFGHPLSKLINDDQLLIVEGEDDERVWAQAARTARGHIKLYPCLARSVDQQIELERYCQEMLPAIYDAAVAFSLRDGDGKTGPMDPLGVVKRFRLHCYAIENLLLTDECLKAFKSSWKDFCHRAEAWIAQQPARKEVETFSAIITSSDRGRHVTLKNVRTLICHILGSKKPWEVHVGQAVGSLFLNSGQSATTGTHSLSDFIGTEFLKAIGLKI